VGEGKRDKDRNYSTKKKLEGHGYERVSREENSRGNKGGKGGRNK